MNLDDPKLTAYALGEITDPAELTEVETWLAANAEGRAYVADTQEMAAFLGKTLHLEETPGLSDAQRASLLNGTYAPQKTDTTDEDIHKTRDSYKPQKIRRSWSIVALTALAACLAAAPLLPWAELLRLRDSSAPTVAFNDKPMTLHMPVEEEKKVARPEAEKLALDQTTRRAMPLLRRESSIDKDLKQAREDFSKAEANAAITDYARDKSEAPAPTLTADASSLSAAAPVTANPGFITAPIQPSDSATPDVGGYVAGTEVQDRFTGKISPVPAPQTPNFADSLQNEISKRGSLSAANGWERPVFPAQSAKKPSSQIVASRAAGFGSGQGGGGVLPKSLGLADGDSRLAGERNSVAADGPNTEAYDAITENDFLAARDNPLSTFSIDVDTASYANIRRFLNDGQHPPKGAVRIEEMLNYFTYDYAKPEGDAPFSTNLEVADCPWQPLHRLVRIGLKGKEIPVAERKAANLVFLIDVSGSMDEPNKLPLLKQSLRLLVDQLGENDRVALAVYAGSSGLVLPSTANKDAIRAALDNLKAGGSTNGASGIQLAYEQAVANFQKDGVNRVILATDGDFNVGVTNQSDLADLITDKAKSGVFLSVLGFGTGNIKDSTMEKLADKGNGNYAYIDSLQEGKKVLVEQIGGTLITIAKDVKIQVEFNPAIVSNYRLIGYENRALKKEDFADDKKDAGEIGSGHTVTALYEVVLVGSMSPEVHAEPLKYSNNIQSKMMSLPSGEMLTVKLRYKESAGDTSKLLEFPLTDKGQKLDTASKDFQFASAVAEFGQLLRQSSHIPLASWESLIARASDAKGEDKGGYRAEFIELAKKAQQLTRRNDS